MKATKLRLFQECQKFSLLSLLYFSFLARETFTFFQKERDHEWLWSSYQRLNALEATRNKLREFLEVKQKMEFLEEASKDSSLSNSHEI